MRRAFLKAVVGLGLVGLFPHRLRAGCDPVKVRPCDGVCCHDAPLRRPSSGSVTNTVNLPIPECEFHDHTMQRDVNSGCRLMADANLIDALTEAEVRRFTVACLGYPHLYRGSGDRPGRCCYEWPTS